MSIKKVKIFETSKYMDKIFHNRMCKELYPDDESASSKKTIKCSFVYNSIDQSNKKIFEFLKNNSEIVYVNGSDESGEKIEKIRNDILKNSQYTIITGLPDIAISNIIKAKTIGVIPIYIYEDINLLNETNVNWNDICVLLHVDDSKSFVI